MVCMIYCSIRESQKSFSFCPHCNLWSAFPENHVTHPVLWVFATALDWGPQIPPWIKTKGSTWIDTHSGFQPWPFNKLFFFAHGFLSVCGWYRWSQCTRLFITKQHTSPCNVFQSDNNVLSQEKHRPKLPFKQMLYYTEILHGFQWHTT